MALLGTTTRSSSTTLTTLPTAPLLPLPPHTQVEETTRTIFQPIAITLWTFAIGMAIAQATLHTAIEVGESIALRLATLARLNVTSSRVPLARTNQQVYPEDLQQ